MTSLYEQIGGATAVGAATKLLYDKLLNDKHLSPFFEDVDIDAQVDKLSAFLTVALGGTNQYQGKSLREAHQHLSLEDSHFDAVATHLQTTLETLKVDATLINTIMATVATTRDDVLNR